MPAVFGARGLCRTGYRRRQKPPLGSQIDGSHPLARGLVVAFVLNENGGPTVYDPAGGLLMPLSGSPAWSSGLRTPTASQFGSMAYPRRLGPAGPPLSIVWQGRSLGTPDNFAAIFGILDGGGGTTPCALAYDNGSPHNLIFKLATDTNSNNFSAGPIPAGTVQFAATCTWYGGINNLINLYVNGLHAGQANLSGSTIAYGSSPTLTFNQVAGFSVNSNTSHDLGYIYAGDLSAGDTVPTTGRPTAPMLEWLAAEPYAFWLPPLSTRYVFFGAAAGAAYSPIGSGVVNSRRILSAAPRAR